MESNPDVNDRDAEPDAVCVDKSFDTKQFKSNMFEMEYPSKSGQHKSFPEIDKIEFFSLNEAKKKINPAQICFLDKLEDIIIEEIKK